MPLFSDEDRRRYFGSRLQGKRTTFLSKSKPKTRGNLLKSKPKAKIQTKNKEKSAKIQTKKSGYLSAGNRFNTLFNTMQQHLAAI